MMRQMSRNTSIWAGAVERFVHQGLSPEEYVAIIRHLGRFDQQSTDYGNDAVWPVLAQLDWDAEAVVLDERFDVEEFDEDDLTVEELRARARFAGDVLDVLSDVELSVHERLEARRRTAPMRLWSEHVEVWYEVIENLIHGRTSAEEYASQICALSGDDDQTSRVGDTCWPLLAQIATDAGRFAGRTQGSAGEEELTSSELQRRVSFARDTLRALRAFQRCLDDRDRRKPVP
jgi:hypothetical protein